MQILNITLVLLSVCALGLNIHPTSSRGMGTRIVAPVSSHHPSPDGNPAEPSGRIPDSSATGYAVQSAAVSISNFKFEPKVLRVKAGTTVTWTNTDGTHTAVSDGENFSSPTLSKGQTFSHKFTKRGRYPYHCSFHGSKGGGNMAGTIIVVP